MKIVYISFSTIPSRIANSIHTMQMCNAIAGMGHEVIVLTPDVKHVEKVEDVYDFYGVEHRFDIKRLPYPDFKGRSVLFGLSTRNYLKRINPDLVLGRSIHGCTMSTELGIPTVFDSHGPITESAWFYRKLFRRMISSGSVKKMTVNSKALKIIYENSSIFDNTGFDPRSIVVAYNGSNFFPLDEFVSLPGDSQKVKAGYFGHLYSGRGVEQIIALAAKLKDVNFYIVGGEDLDINLWRDKAQSENVFFMGYVPYPEVYKYRNSCDILLAPYQKVVSPEGTTGDQSYYMNPIKIIEYMSSRKPILASALPTIQEVLNYNNAILADCENMDEWVSAIRHLTKDTAFASAIAANAYSDFHDRFSWEARAKKLIS